MKVTELMTGDIVRVAKDVCIKKGTIVKVQSIDAENSFPEKNLKGCATCVQLDDRTISGGVWTEYLEPIPLTPEILKKNNFKKNDTLDFYTLKIDKQLAGDGFEEQTIDVYYNNLLLIQTSVCQLQLPIKYIHEFQHALKLCGINIEITL